MPDSVLNQLTALERMDVSALRDRWRALYGTEPPATYRRKLLVRRLAYRIQELAFGGLPDETKARLRQVADENPLGGGRKRRDRRVRRRNVPVAGTRLIREWHGTRFEVTVLRDGFEFEGRRYRSLTAVARAITGAHHSGPRFFGLQQAGKEAS
ncbi:MAG: DUF2924 domain-containing protein [Phycisphaerae bacterium]